MSARPARVAQFDTFVSRSGYTGEDGYESRSRRAGGEFRSLLLAEPTSRRSVSARAIR